MVFCPEHPKRDQNLKFTPLSETTSIPAPFIWESPLPPHRGYSFSKLQHVEDYNGILVANDTQPYKKYNTFKAIKNKANLLLLIQQQSHLSWTHVIVEHWADQHHTISRHHGAHLLYERLEFSMVDSSHHLNAE